MTLRAAPTGFPRMGGTYDESKFAEMLVLAAELLASDHRGGATKLNKLLYFADFADFAHVRTHGRPIFRGRLPEARARPRAAAAGAGPSSAHRRRLT